LRPGIAEIFQLILLNLLPHREAARKKRREQFYAAIALAALVGLGIAVLAYGWLQAAIAGQQSNNGLLDTEIKALDQKIKDIKGLQTQIEALQARQRAVEDVQSDRNQSVHLLAELVRQLPPGVLLTRLVQSEQTISISGSAQTNDQVSELLRNLGGRSPWFSKPELIETAAATISLSAKDQRPVFNFSMRATLTRTAEPITPPAAPASGVAPLASPPASKSPL
jgi:type IV pilus assembly protein PilN